MSRKSGVNHELLLDWATFEPFESHSLEKPRRLMARVGRDHSIPLLKVLQQLRSVALSATVPALVDEVQFGTLEQLCAQLLILSHNAACDDCVFLCSRHCQILTLNRERLPGAELFVPHDLSLHFAQASKW